MFGRNLKVLHNHISSAENWKSSAQIYKCGAKNQSSGQMRTI